MLRNLKYLGLAAVAALAIGAMGVLSARAAVPEFHLEVAPALLEGEQVVPLIFEDESGFTVKCTTAKFNETKESKTSTGMTLTPTFGGCLFVGVASEFKTNGCGFFFSLVGASKPPTAKMNVSCPTEQGMEIVNKKIFCTITIGAQKGLPHATFANAGANDTRDTTISIVIEEMKYEEKGELCPSPGFHEFGEYAGTVTLKAYKDEGGKKGAQVGFWAD